MLGAAPMIGPASFSLSDARTLASFAARQGLGLVAYWAMDRDRAFAFRDAFARR
jgi:hypothetical protein